MADSGTPKRKFKQDIVTSQELFGGPVIKDEEPDKVKKRDKNPCINIFFL